MRFHPLWATLAAVIFVTEALIALFVRDEFVRPYVGDVLVVMLIFFTLLAVIPARPLPLAAVVLLFAFAVEITQGFGLIGRLGLQNDTAARIVLGDTFQWGDLLCYVLGVLISVAMVRMRGTEKP